MDSKRTKKIIGFLKEIDKLKHVERKIKLRGRSRLETDAEHSWHVAMFVILFEKDLPKIDIAKTLKIALIHDLVEIYAGDTFAFDIKNNKSQKFREEKAAKRLFGTLPEDLKKDFFKLYREYENSSSKEGKIAQSFDKLQPIMQNIMNRGFSWKKYNVEFENIDSYKKKFMTHDKNILKVYNLFLKEIKKRGLAAKRNEKNRIRPK